MNGEIARIALEFMKRVQLNGAEVQAYQAVVATLSQYANQEEEQQDDGGQADE
jgi:hypothetical protein